ncbi:MAG: branched-chain amino acid transaminase [Chloroflexi bacterium]|nr:branched-chain amino acid transaminase [Chloroflexota bacterium]
MSNRYAYFRGEIVPLAEAKIGVMNHTFNYGTGVFEGIRGYWNEDEGQLYLFRMRDHYERLERSCRILTMSLPKSIDELCDITLEVVRRSGHREDCYVRPLVYKESELVGVRLHSLADGFLIYTSPFGAYLPPDRGIRCHISTWRRIDDNAIPARAKVTGLYVNSALTKSEAMENGYDEGIVLTNEGHVSEGSAENIFLVEKNTLITPPVSDNILVGITRNTVMQLAKEEFGIETIERVIDRTELYVADEVLLTGSAAEVTPVVEIDRRKVGNGQVGPIAAKLQALYSKLIRGKVSKYKEWCTPVYPVE